MGRNKALFRGPIAWMARNTVASNLLMFVLLFGGFVGLLQVKQEVFPEFTLDLVMVSVPYPGASPEEVEQGILLAIEGEVRGVDGVDRVTSTANEGIGQVNVYVLLGADPDKVLADVKNAVDRVTTLPEDAEKPQVSLVAPVREVISLVISGEQDLSLLHAMAEKARAGLMATGEVTQVELFGVPPLEIAVEIDRERLQALGLSMAEVARAIAASSMELPAGAIETRKSEVLVRVDDRAERGEQLEDILIAATPNGAQVRLRDIANVRDGYADTDQASYYNGVPAVRVTAYRVGSETPKSVSTAVKAYAEKLVEELPDNIEIATWRDDSELLSDRISLLVNNGIFGLILVFLVLALFLNLRLAFWVGLGIPISFLGAFALMPGMDLSINMITLFAFIVTLGMVVDDAIVVGENAFEKMEAGLPRIQASIEGAREMAMPVTFAVLTTMAAFAPLLFVPGTMGKIFRFLPSIVVLVLGFSLIESFFVLPAHLGHEGSGWVRAQLERTTPGRWVLSVARAINPVRLWEPVRLTVGRGLEAFTRFVYRPTLHVFIRFRYIAMAAAIAVLMVTFAAVARGLVPFNFFPVLEGDQVTATARLPYGVPIERTREVQVALEDALDRALQEKGATEYVRGVFARVGEGPEAFRAGRATGSHLVTLEVALVPSGERDLSAAEIQGAWSAQIPKDLAGVDVLKVSSNVGPSAGTAVDVQLSHPDTEVLAAASAKLADELATFPELANIENTYASGKPQLDFHLNDNARALGLTAETVARQLRANLFGAEAVREQRGRNELKVMVRLPDDQRASEFDLEQLRVLTPMGSWVPLAYVATSERGRAPTSIAREEGARIVNVKGELGAGVVSPRDSLEMLQSSSLPRLQEEFPDLQASLVGAQREQNEAFASLGMNYLIALFVIYALLAIPFRSYVQPLIIMSCIPFGLVGAIAGHVLMGYSMSIISMFGIVALSGVVVNDSLVLIDAVNKGRAAGKNPHEAIVWAGTRRIRPILLTSLTTFFGLAPMIVETSVQARFLIPMAISLGFGVLFATVIVLLLVPSLYMIVEDFRFPTKAARPEVDEERAAAK